MIFVKVLKQKKRDLDVAKKLIKRGIQACFHEYNRTKKKPVPIMQSHLQVYATAYIYVCYFFQNLFIETIFNYIIYTSYFMNI